MVVYDLLLLGEVIRRLLSKICLNLVITQAIQHLSLMQVGVGIRNGVEAVFHATNRLIRSEETLPSTVLLLVDFHSAFNSINRKIMLDEVRQPFPTIYPWV